SLSGSLHNVAEDFFSSSSSPGSSLSSCSSSHPDLSSCSLPASGEVASPASCPRSPRPVYNKQGADSCIVRVSVEYGSNGNMYKSILLTSQDHTPQVIQRALEKHNMETHSCQDFSLYQLLNQDKALDDPLQTPGQLHQSRGATQEPRGQVNTTATAWQEEQTTAQGDG
ncbi:hypothetical protein CRUP_014912, partial [Coryphaenoides rupestris]